MAAAAILSTVPLQRCQIVLFQRCELFPDNKRTAFFTLKKSWIFKFCKRTLSSKAGSTCNNGLEVAETIKMKLKSLHHSSLAAPLEWEE